MEGKKILSGLFLLLIFFVVLLLFLKSFNINIDVNVSKNSLENNKYNTNSDSNKSYNIDNSDKSFESNSNNNSNNNFENNNDDSVVSDAQNVSFDNNIEDPDFTNISFCGDGFCSIDEKNNCCNDCGCASGVCINNVCSNLSFKFQTNFNYVGPVEKEPLINSLGTRDYLVVTITSVKKVTNKKFDNNNYEEYGLFSYAFSGDNVQMYKFPFKGTYNLRYNPSNSNVILFELDTEKYGSNSRVPVFSMPLSSIEGKNVYLRFLVVEIDKPLVVENYVYSDEDTAINNLYSGNDVLFDKSVILKPSDYSLGEHTLRSDNIVLKYKVEKLKGITSNAKVSVLSHETYLKHPLDGFTSKYSPVGYTEEESEVLVLTRLAREFEHKGFGVEPVYENDQEIHSSVFGGFSADLYGENSALKLLEYKYYVYNGRYLLNSPFLYFEADLLDIDSECSGPSDYYCYNAIKSNLFAFERKFYTAEELVDYYDKGIRELNITKYNYFTDLNFTVRLDEFS